MNILPNSKVKAMAESLVVPKTSEGGMGIVFFFFFQKTKPHIGGSKDENIPFCVFSVFSSLLLWWIRALFVCVPFFFLAIRGGWD